ncbi:MAG: hydrogenase formation protein HypD [Candidatus Omnitrophica bacterium]|nr:hydrogenase formation protein HypD [Candidatus Omnitrophota bacterium]
MRYIDEFRNKKLIEKICAKIKKITPSYHINIMEVCGTHTQSFFRFALDKLLPKNLRLISGPGCPVCVSTQEYIEETIRLAKDKKNIILTFGDLLRVPAANSTLEQERAKGAQVVVVYSPWDSLNFAQTNPKKRIIFLAVGFETTAPTIALSILAAKKQNIRNLFFFSALKLIPPAMRYLAEDPQLRLHGFLCPGHVSTIIGTSSYEFIPRRYGIACCVAGFEPLDILEGIYLLIQQIADKKPTVANQYIRVVTRTGNLKAKRVIQQVFKVSDASWRGLGNIPKSGLRIKKEFARFDAEDIFSLRPKTYDSKLITNRCRCGDVLKGIISPTECPLFSKTCSPQNPQGPCMVSYEGACNAYFKYRSKDKNI